MDTENIVLPPGHFRQRIGHQYSNIPRAIIREILQNSLDAGASTIDFRFTEHGFMARDNGHGMTLEDFRAYWRNLGGSKKETNSIGGFGAAKELLSYAWESWYIKSLDFAVTGHLIDMTSEPDKNKGFEIGATDDMLDHGKLALALDHIVTRSYRSGVTVTAQGEKLSWGRRFNKTFHSFKWADLYKVNPSAMRGHEQAGYVYVRAGGLFTFDFWTGGDHCWYLEITGNPIDMLSENRDSLKYEFLSEVARFVSEYTQENKHEIRPKAKITVYGLVGNSDESESGGIGGNSHDKREIESLPSIWREPIAILEDGKKQGAVKDGVLRPKYARMLEVWTQTVRQVCELADIEMPVTGFFFGDSVAAVHTEVGGQHVLAISPDAIVGSSGFGVLEIVIHELAHYGYSSHGQDYESERMGIAGKVGDGAWAILGNVGRLLARV